MDRGLQERLVGAAVLVALGVWLIPWVLDGSSVNDSSPEKTAELVLPVPEPPPGSAIRRQTIELNAERGASAKSPEPSTDATGNTQVNAADSATAAVSEQAAEPRSEPTEQARTEPVAQVANETPASDAVQSDGAVDSDTQSQRQGAAQTRSAAEATPQAALPDIITASRVAGWMVQLGSFSDAGNARRQAQRIETYGHDAHIYEFAAAGGRTMFRVRLGPLETRERAQATASSLAAHGFVAQLVAPE